MEDFIKLTLRMIGIILGITLIVIFLIPLLAIFLILFLIQSIFRVKLLNARWMRPETYRKSRKKPEPPSQDVPASQDIIDVEAVDLPDDDNRSKLH